MATTLCGTAALGGTFRRQQRVGAVRLIFPVRRSGYSVHARVKIGEARSCFSSRYFATFVLLLVPLMYEEGLFLSTRATFELVKLFLLNYIGSLRIFY